MAEANERTSGHWTHKVFELGAWRSFVFRLCVVDPGLDCWFSKIVLPVGHFKKTLILLPNSNA